MERQEAATAEFYSELCASLIREHQAEILACWEERVKALPVARALQRPELLDHIPEVLERIARRVEQGGSPHARTVGANRVEIHAVDRYEKNFDLAAVTTELGMLRSCVLLVLEHVERHIPVAALRLLDQAIDGMVTASIAGYVDVRERTLQVFDQIATAALDSRSLDELVHRLLEILVNSSESIDMASLLVPGKAGVMQVRASIGDDEDPVRARFSEGVARQAASSHRAVEVRDIYNSRVHALYAIPLLDAAEVVAVLLMSSLSAEGFSLDDKRLLRAVGLRATAAIRQHMLRETAERSTRDLRRREEEFHALADNIPQFAWMADARGRSYWYNKRWLEYSGTTLEEMRTLGPIPFIHPDHRERVVESFRAAFAEGSVWEKTYPMRSQSGHYRWFLCRAMPIRGGHGTIARWFGTATDVTDQRFLDEATKLLNSSLDYEETLHQIARLAVPDLADWCVVDLAEGHEIRRVAIAGVNVDAAQRSQDWDRTYPPLWNADTGVERAIRTGEPVLIPLITDDQLVKDAINPDHLRDLRALGLVSCIIAPLMARGRALGAVTLVTAESRRTYGRTEFEVAAELARRAGTAVDNARLYKESQQALSERQQAVQSREEVLAIVSHDLRGPLNTIGMSTTLLEQKHPDPESSKRLDLIHRSADCMEHMIDDLLDVATIDAKGLVLRRAMEDADQLLARAVESHEPAAARGGIQITCGALGPVPVHCDRERVERVFTNLIGNALKFCRRGDVISVGGFVVDGDVVFSVSDTGPGIPPAQLPHVFERYWTSTHGGTKGTGLGLYICKGIVEAHGGTLWVESVVGRGTTFWFSLPLAEDARATAAPPRGPINMSGGSRAI